MLKIRGLDNFSIGVKNEYFKGKSNVRVKNDSSVNKNRYSNITPTTLLAEKCKTHRKNGRE
jgi:hypothetical protein